jgi:SAM-dependent methyltransferase
VESQWQALTEGVARARGWPALDQKREVAAGIRLLSDGYNAGRFRIAWTPSTLAARLHFFLVRDALKMREALRDVPLAVPVGGGEPARVLDVGAGFGASTLGLSAALAGRACASGEGSGVRLEVTLVDTDLAALDVAREVLASRAEVLQSGRTLPDGQFDLVLFGQVLVEMGAGEAEDRSVERHASMLEEVVRHRLRPGGRVVVLEPALRSCARRLQATRDRLVERGIAVVAPCTHERACPLLSSPRDWCHDDRAIDLPPWLHPIAREAGLRWQGLTFSRLILAHHCGGRPGFRVVAPPRDSRGRRERRLCGLHADGACDRWVDRLDRHRCDANGAWDELQRGDGLDLDPSDRRVGPDTVVRRFAEAPDG